jgi:NADH:ubiquinone reductase (non-electrogenic)
MATKAAIRPLVQLTAAVGLKQTGRRGFATAPRAVTSTFRAPARAQFNKPQLQSSFRRGVADAAAPVKKRRFRVFRWTWRLIYLSALGGLGYVGYGIVVNRNPVEQAEADPTKKTLVVLGRTIPCSNAMTRS